VIKQIEKAKFYPKAARRRGIVGKVDVAFTLDCKGGASGVALKQGHKLLRKGAGRSIQDAQPFPPPPPGVSCPMDVTYAMTFELK
jgi:protein TonB